MTSKHKLLAYVLVAVSMAIGYIGIGFGSAAAASDSQPNLGRFWFGVVGVSLTLGISIQEKSEF